MSEELFALTDGEHSPVADSAAVVLSSRKKGDVSELLFEVGAVARGWDVCTPRGQAESFDYIIKRPQQRPIAVQVKRARRNSFRPKHWQIRCSGADSSVPYRIGDFDVLAVHLPDLEEFVFYTLEEVNGRAGMSYNPDADHHRDPGNWRLLDEVAESLTANQKSFAA